MRKITVALCLAPLMLTACGEGKSTSAGGDRYAGLDAEIRAWKDDIAKTDALCRSQAKGQACEAFEVACKSERPITPEDAAKGVSAKVVAAMTFQGWQAEGGARPGNETAAFAKVGGAWTRAEAKPVNLSTCADL